jgi:hypothetical protein
MLSEHSEPSDSELQKIIDENQGYMAALLDAYEPLERFYLSAVAPLDALAESTNTTSFPLAYVVDATSVR